MKKINWKPAHSYAPVLDEHLAIDQDAKIKIKHIVI